MLLSKVYKNLFLDSIMKKSLLILVMTLCLINFASAYYGSYGSFSLGDLLDSIDSSTMILGAVFIISFAVLNFALSRAFRDNRATAGVVAFVISLLITYGINKTGFNIEELFYGIGISSDFLYFILPILLLIGAIYLGTKVGFGIMLIIIGALFIIITFTDLIYAKGIMFLSGIISLIAGFFINKKCMQF